MKSYVTEDGILITHPDELGDEELCFIIADERRMWAKRGKELAEINITMAPDKPGELDIKTVEKSPIKRIRRITGYLSKVDNFNASKQAELADREVHVKF